MFDESFEPLSTKGNSMTACNMGKNSGESLHLAGEATGVRADFGRGLEQHIGRFQICMHNAHRVQIAHSNGNVHCAQQNHLLHETVKAR